MRKIFIHFTAVLFSAALIFCAFYSVAFADAALYRGAKNIGAVQTIENNSGILVPIEDVGRLLGFSSSHSGEELLLTKGNTQLKVINNSAAAWSGFSIIPLMSAPVQDNGKFWVDSLSAAALFQNSIGGGQNNKLRFTKISGKVVAAAKTEIDFGTFDEPEPEPEIKPVTVAQTPVNIPVPKPVEPVKTVKQIEPQQPEQPQQQQQPVQASTQTQTQTKSETKSKSQPRYESFKLSDSKPDEEENFSGTIHGIRWTSQEGKHKKIRAVIMTDEGADPTVYMSDKALHVLFSSSLESSQSLESPFANIKTELKRQAEGFEFILRPDRISKAEKIILNNPRRIILDFFFPETVNLVRTAPVKNQTTVAQNQTPVQPVQPVQPKSTTKTTTKKSEPVIKIDGTKKQAQTQNTIPQQAITIPMSKSAAQRSGRKTIVIDPGHGGKDPGASANGVTEKNVNLGIGLELEKVLLARGYNVVMTRRTDVYLKLQERTDIANEQNADLFVSIHVNALPSKKSMTGFEIYIMALPTDKDAMNLAKIENREYVEGKGMDSENVDRRTEMLLKILGDMQQNNKISESTDFAAALYNAGVRNNLPMRRVAQAPFFVLRGAGMPAVLLETGFVTNAAESQKLTTTAYQQQIANAMSEGIINYLR